MEREKQESENQRLTDTPIAFLVFTRVGWGHRGPV